jgi:hypothetical protein
MHRPGRLALAVAGLAWTAAPPALADPPVTHGVVCLFVATPDPTAELGTWIAVLLGGPVVQTEADGQTPESGTLGCQIVVSPAPVADHDSYGPAVLGHGSGVFTAGPQVTSYMAMPNDNVFLCASFVDDSDGVTHYWDAAHDGWSTSPDVPCTLAEGSDQPTETDQLVDAAVCPQLATLLPPEGDVADRWDCPPYTSGQERHTVQAAVVLHA